jgi:hypothetical protein
MGRVNGSLVKWSVFKGRCNKSLMTRHKLTREQSGRGCRQRQGTALTILSLERSSETTGFIRALNARKKGKKTCVGTPKPFFPCVGTLRTPKNHHHLCPQRYFQKKIYNHFTPSGTPSSLSLLSIYFLFSSERLEKRIRGCTKEEYIFF